MPAILAVPAYHTVPAEGALQGQRCQHLHQGQQGHHSALSDEGRLFDDNLTTVSSLTSTGRDAGKADTDFGAVMYIAAVLVFYSLGIVVMIVKYLKTERKEMEEEMALESFFKGIPSKKLQHTQDAVNRVAIQAFHTLTSAAQQRDPGWQTMAISTNSSKRSSKGAATQNSSRPALNQGQGTADDNEDDDDDNVEEDEDGSPSLLHRERSKYLPRVSLMFRDNSYIRRGDRGAKSSSQMLPRQDIVQAGGRVSQRGLYPVEEGQASAQADRKQIYTDLSAAASLSRLRSTVAENEVDASMNSTSPTNNKYQDTDKAASVSSAVDNSEDPVNTRTATSFRTTGNDLSAEAVSNESSTCLASFSSTSYPQEESVCLKGRRFPVPKVTQCCHTSNLSTVSDVSNEKSQKEATTKALTSAKPGHKFKFKARPTGSVRFSDPREEYKYHSSDKRPLKSNDSSAPSRTKEKTVRGSRHHRPSKDTKREPTRPSAEKSSQELNCDSIEQKQIETGTKMTNARSRRRSAAEETNDLLVGSDSATSNSNISCAVVSGDLFYVDRVQSSSEYSQLGDRHSLKLSKVPGSKTLSGAKEKNSSSVTASLDTNIDQENPATTQTTVEIPQTHSLVASSACLKTENVSSFFDCGVTKNSDPNDNVKLFLPHFLQTSYQSPDGFPIDCVSHEPKSSSCEAKDHVDTDNRNVCGHLLGSYNHVIIASNDGVNVLASPKRLLVSDV